MSDEIREVMAFGQIVRIIPLATVEGHPCQCKEGKHVEWVCPYCGSGGSGCAEDSDGYPILTEYFSVVCEEFNGRIFLVHWK